MNFYLHKKKKNYPFQKYNAPKVYNYYLKNMCCYTVENQIDEAQC